MTFFFDKRFPFGPLTLKELCKCQLFVNIFIKRIDMIINLKLPTLKQNEHLNNMKMWQNL